jgi:hypothetical protein
MSGRGGGEAEERAGEAGNTAPMRQRLGQKKRAVEAAEEDEAANDRRRRVDGGGGRSLFRLGVGGGLLEDEWAGESRAGPKGSLCGP